MPESFGEPARVEDVQGRNSRQQTFDASLAVPLTCCGNSGLLGDELMERTMSPLVVSFFMDISVIKKGPTSLQCLLTHTLFAVALLRQTRRLLIAEGTASVVLLFCGN